MREVLFYTLPLLCNPTNKITRSEMWDYWRPLVRPKSSYPSFWKYFDERVFMITPQNLAMCSQISICIVAKDCFCSAFYKPKNFFLLFLVAEVFTGYFCERSADLFFWQNDNGKTFCGKGNFVQTMSQEVFYTFNKYSAKS